MATDLEVKLARIEAKLDSYYQLTAEKYELHEKRIEPLEKGLQTQAQDMAVLKTNNHWMSVVAGSITSLIGFALGIVFHLPPHF